MVQLDAMSRRSPALLILVLSLSAGSAPAADWPQWRGAERNGKSAESGLLQAWPDGGPPLAWKATGLGEGYSSLSVKGNRIFTMGDIDGAQYAIALERDGGALLWKTRVGPPHVGPIP